MLPPGGQKYQQLRENFQNGDRDRSLEPPSPPAGGDSRSPHLDGEQPGQVDLGDGFGGGLVLHAASLGLGHLVDVVGRTHQVEGVVVLQQRVLCGTHTSTLSGSSFRQSEANYSLLTNQNQTETGRQRVKIC